MPGHDGDGHIARHMVRNVLPTLLASALLAAAPAPAAHAAPPFDYYLLSLSIEPTFCSATPRNASKPDCRRLTADSFRAVPLTLHGLWPNIARVGVRRQPRNCEGPAYAVSPGVSAGLDRYMPAGDGLARYEWRTHGTCSGLSPEAYFTAAVTLTRQANEAIGPALLDSGGTVALDALQRRVAAIDPALAGALVVDCRTPRGGGGALLAEIRLTVGRDFRPIPVESVGMRANSGCPAGIGRIPPLPQ